MSAPRIDARSPRRYRRSSARRRRRAHDRGHSSRSPRLALQEASRSVDRFREGAALFASRVLSLKLSRTRTGAGPLVRRVRVADRCVGARGYPVTGGGSG